MTSGPTACCTPSNNGSGRTPDLLVIGAGSAGFAAAIRGSELGAHVTLVGHGTLGGTCVNVGCVPSKTLIRAVEALHQGRAAHRFAGIRGKTEIADWAALVAQKDELVAQLRKAKYADVLPSYNRITYAEGPARLTPDGARLNGHHLAPGRIVIATGAAPAVPPIDGLSAVPHLTSTTALELDALPRSLIVVGGGPIGCELGQMFARAGVRVSILCRSRLLSDGEPEISEALSNYLRDEGIDVRCGVTYKSVRADASGVALALGEADGRSTVLHAERLLVATGRRPNTQGLGLGDTGVEMNPRGGIVVDDFLRTTKAGVYAAGDITGRDMFVYMAAYGGKVAAENAVLGDSRAYDATAIP